MACLMAIGDTPSTRDNVLVRPGRHKCRQRDMASFHAASFRAEACLPTQPRTFLRGFLWTSALQGGARSQHLPHKVCGHGGFDGAVSLHREHFGIVAEGESKPLAPARQGLLRQAGRARAATRSGCHTDANAPSRCWPYMCGLLKHARVLCCFETCCLAEQAMC